MGSDSSCGLAIKNHSNLLVLSFCLFLFLSSFSFAAGENVRVGIYDNPPKIFIDSAGVVSGFNADLVNAIANKEGWTVEYVNGSWNEGLERVEAGQIDVMVDVAYSAERAQRFAFNNETVFVDWGEIYVPGDSNINSFTDLEGKRVAVMNGSILTVGSGGILNLTRSFDVHVIPVYAEDYAHVFMLVENGSADAGVTNRVFGDAYSTNYRLKPTAIIFNPTSLKFAFPKNGTQTSYLIERFDADLKELKADHNSVYYVSMRKYMSAFLGTVEEMPFWVYVIFALLFAIMALIAVFAFIYRLQKIEIELKERELEETNARLKELALAKDNFIRDMSHELKTPLAVMLGNISLIGKLVKPEKGSPLEKILAMLERNGRRMHTSINEILQLSKLDTLEIQREPVQLKAVVDDIYGEYLPLAQMKGIELTLDARPVSITGDAQMLRLAISNLVSNAIKFTDKGHVAMSLSQSPGGSEALVSVSDTGLGISEEHQKMLFQKFFKANSEAPGTGIGLVIIKGIIDKHGGKIKVESSLGKGTTFRLSIPKGG